MIYLPNVCNSLPIKCVQPLLLMFDLCSKVHLRNINMFNLYYTCSTSALQVQPLLSCICLKTLLCMFNFCATSSTIALLYMKTLLCVINFCSTCSTSPFYDQPLLFIFNSGLTIHPLLYMFNLCSMETISISHIYCNLCFRYSVSSTLGYSTVPY
jgi:hypothetical protein